MMSTHIYLAFVGLVVVLMLVPGPNVALIVANSVRYGVGYGLVTVAGTGSAMAVQLGLTALGLSGLLGHFGVLFGWLRWIGAIYLIYLGVVQWRSAPVGLVGADRGEVGPGRLWLRGFFVSLTNPKTLLFYGALLPQFIDRSRAVGPQMAVLAGTFLVIALMIDSGWCVAAGLLRVRLRDGGIARRIAGGALIGAGLGLALNEIR